MSHGQAPEKLAYTVQEAAEMLSLSRSLVYRLIDAGEIQTIKFGRARRITFRQLDAFIRAQEQRNGFLGLRPVPSRSRSATEKP